MKYTRLDQENPTDYEDYCNLVDILDNAYPTGER